MPSYITTVIIMATLPRKKRASLFFLAQEEKEKKKDCRTGGAHKEAALLVRQPAATKLFLCVLILDISLQSVSSFMRLWGKKRKKNGFMGERDHGEKEKEKNPTRINFIAIKNLT